MTRLAIYFHRLSQAGGAERMACGLANALSAFGHRVLLVSWDAPGAEPFYPLRDGVAWYRLGFRPGLRDKFRRTLVLARLLRRERARILIGFVMSGDRTVFVAARLAGVALVAAERSAPSMYRLQYSAFQRWQCFLLLRLVDRIVVQFEAFAGGYPAALRSRMAAIPNPVAPARLLASPGTANAAGRYTLLAVGRLDDTPKRLTCLIDGFARVANTHPAWDLEIVGDGPDMTLLKEHIVRHGLQARARLLPARLEIADAYAGSHLFAMPSLWEGFPNALAEAMAHGLPAVGFANADGVRHLIEHGETGWLVRGFDDPDAFAQALDTAMDDPEERVQRGARATRAMRAYAPDEQIAKWRVLVEDLAGASP